MLISQDLTTYDYIVQEQRKERERKERRRKLKGEKPGVRPASACCGGKTRHVGDTDNAGKTGQGFVP
eukprot:g8820.t1